MTLSRRPVVVFCGIIASAPHRQEDANHDHRQDLAQVPSSPACPPRRWTSSPRWLRRSPVPLDRCSSRGQQASRLYLLRTGKINVQVQPTALTEPLTIVSLSTFGQLVGWSGFMPNYYTASALCLEDSSLLAFEGQAFNRLLEDNPALGLIVMRRIAQVISQRLRTIQGSVIKLLYHQDQ